MRQRLHRAARFEDTSASNHELALRIHTTRCYDGGRTQRSRLGTLTDKVVQTVKWRLPSPLLKRCTSITKRFFFLHMSKSLPSSCVKVHINKCSIMFTPLSICVTYVCVMDVTKPTYVIAWILHICILFAVPPVDRMMVFLAI